MYGHSVMVRLTDVINNKADVVIRRLVVRSVWRTVGLAIGQARHGWVRGGGLGRKGRQTAGKRWGAVVGARWVIGVWLMLGPSDRQKMTP